MGIHAASPIPKPSSAPSIPIRSFVLNSVTKVHHYKQQIASGTHFSPHEEREPLAQCTLFGGDKHTKGLCFLSVRGYECHVGSTAKALPLVGHHFS